MDVTLLIRQRLAELGLDQKALAAATEVTESYISQLLTRKKAPPAAGRTDIYEKIGKFLGLPAEELSRLAEEQRRQDLKRKIAEPPRPLLQGCRKLILNKCSTKARRELRRIFEKDTFGELERLVTQKILDVAKDVAREELRNEKWLRELAALSNSSYEQMRVAVLEFLDTDVYHVSAAGCDSFLEPMIDYWEIDLKTFRLDIGLNRRLAPRGIRRFEFAEQTSEQAAIIEPGFEQFLSNKSLSGTATDEEIEVLVNLKLNGRRPSPLYYYRELQNLRDPLNFVDVEPTDASGR